MNGRLASWTSCLAGRSYTYSLYTLTQLYYRSAQTLNNSSQHSYLLNSNFDFIEYNAYFGQLFIVYYQHIITKCSKYLFRDENARFQSATLKTFTVFTSTIG